jgi:hypothetical protein
MWESTYEKTYPGLDKHSVWTLWADVNRWHEWDRDIEWARMSEPFQAGSAFELKPKGGPRVSLRLTRAESLKGYSDLARFPLARMHGIHDMVETAEGLKLTITIRVEGPLAWLWRKIVAEGVAAEVPQQMDALAAFARRAA